MTTAYTSLLGLALPVTGELSGTWGDTVNTAITSLLDTAIAGTTSITTDSDITLSTTTGASNQARQAIILWNPASGTTTRYITAPAQSKMYVVINASGGTQSVVIRGAGPTTGVTIAKGESATVAWNGSDFVKVSSSGGAITFTDLTVTGNTILGDAAADTLTVNATSTFASPVNFQGQVKLPSTGRSAAAALTPTNPAFLYGVASTYTDTTSSGTLAPVASFYGLAQPTLSTSNVTTYTTAATLYIANAPATGGSATITNPYALYIAAGDMYLGGNLRSNLTFSADNTYDIGASGATRPRNLFLSNTATIGGGLTVAGNTFLGDSSGDSLTLNGSTINLNTTADIYGNGSQTTSIQTTLGITAQTSGTAGAGFGTSLGFNAEGSDGSNYALTTIDSYWSDATPATRTSVMDLCTRVNAGNVTPRLSIAGNGTFTFKNVGTDAGVTKMTLNSVGLSIGTTVTANYPLEVYNTSAGTGTIGAALINNSSTAATGVGLVFQPSSASTRTAQIKTYNDGSNGISMTFALSNQNTPNERVWFKMDGKVGIGLDPTYFFDVAKQSIGTIARFGGDDTGANSRGLTIASSTTTYIGDTFTLNAPSNGGTIVLQTFNTNAMYINNSQEVGFGQNPLNGYRIAINGYAQFNNSTGDEFLNVISSASGGRNWNIGSTATSSSIAPAGCFAFRDSTIGETRMWIRGDAFGVNIGPYAATKTPWNGFTAYDIKNGMSSLTNFNSADTFLNHQVYYDGNWRFSTTGQSAATIDIFSNTDGGAYEFRVSPTSNASATAGNVTTWNYPVGINKYGIGLGNTGLNYASSGTGIRFPTTQNNSSNVNTLDDYEEGTWTPTPAGSITAGTYTAAGVLGTYTKIGRSVTVTCVIYATGFTGTGDFTVTGLPFPITDNVATGAVQFNSNPFAGLLTVPSQITAMFFDGSSLVSFRQSDNSVSGGGYSQLSCRGSAGYTIEYLRFSCTYQTTT